jgi:tetratricopeptide (TPR) repeat protein
MQQPRQGRVGESWIGLLVGLLLVAAMGGCTPPGPRALLQGERFLQQGKPAEAVARLEEATTLLPADARAWNFLGLAYQAASRPADAAKAYAQALALDRNLAAARFNLGCLWLEQNQPTQAVLELTTFTSLQLNSAVGWLKLGQAQLRAGQPDAAVTSFTRVLQLKVRPPRPATVWAWLWRNASVTRRRSSSSFRLTRCSPTTPPPYSIARLSPINICAIPGWRLPTTGAIWPWPTCRTPKPSAAG